MATESTPDCPSSDYSAMLPYWNMVETILDGADAMRAAGQAYLPQFPNETETDYDYRRLNAKFTNIYADIVSNLAAKPFSEEVSLDDKTPQRIKDLSEDIDGRGNHLHVFAGSIFFSGINSAIDWILVDYAKVQAGATLADERKIGARPYWVHIPAKRMLAVYTAVIAGKEEFVHARMREDATERQGYDEACTERIRVFNRDPLYAIGEDGAVTDIVIGYAAPTFELWQKSTAKEAKEAWELIDGGPITIGVIPLVPFITGRRKEGSWRFVPPLKDAAFLQIEHYQQETALKSIKEMAAFPMLAGNGVTPLMEGGKVAQVPVGPRTVLYAPAYSGDSTGHGEWAFIEPTAASLKFLADDVKNTEQQLRELGRQPLTAQTGNLTVVTTAFAASKGNSAIQAWALNLKDALEQALKLTCKWLNDPSEPTIDWNLDDLDLAMNDDKGPDTLNTARAAGDLSRDTYWKELKRRSILSADFDAEKEKDALIKELPDLDTEEDITAAVPPPKTAAAA